MSETHEPPGIAEPQTEVSDETITIYVNRHPFRVARTPVTGRVLRDLPTPPLDDETDLLRIMPGGVHDLLVDPDEVLELEDEAAFFSVPRTIMAGGRIV